MQLCSWVFLTLWAMAIRSNTVASFEQKMQSKVEFRVLAGQLYLVHVQHLSEEIQQQMVTYSLHIG